MRSDDGSDDTLAVIHRPRYDDWSLPKGKLDDGEDDHAAAVREVHEETGVEGRVVGDLGEISYEVDKGEGPFTKVVRYFVLEATRVGPFEPDGEVDELRWLTPSQARGVLTYDRDRDVLDRYLEAR